MLNFRIGRTQEQDQDRAIHINHIKLRMRGIFKTHSKSLQRKRGFQNKTMIFLPREGFQNKITTFLLRGDIPRNNMNFLKSHLKMITRQLIQTEVFSNNILFFFILKVHINMLIYFPTQYYCLCRTNYFLLQLNQC